MRHETGNNVEAFVASSEGGSESAIRRIGTPWHAYMGYIICQSFYPCVTVLWILSDCHAHVTSVLDRVASREQRIPLLGI